MIESRSGVVWLSSVTQLYLCGTMYMETFFPPPVTESDRKGSLKR
jgi:hypothetical protein